jgi:GNAT superfamily N-acetyltransferase
MTSDPTKHLENYDLLARTIARDDVPMLHTLSVAVGWPHRAEDWDMLLDLGQGVVAEDEIGRLVGSAMWFPLGADRVSVGMVITSPRLQENGAGRWLMERILADIGDRGMVLSATKAAFRLYLSLGFRPGATVSQHQGIVSAAPSPDTGARPMTDADEAGVRALDAAAFGGERRAVLDSLLAVSTGTVMGQGGALRGFALRRRFGRGRVIGPVVAETEADAMALVAPLLADLGGAFARVDTREPEGVFRDWLTAAGLARHDTVTSMARGREHPAPGPARTFGLASQALG